MAFSYAVSGATIQGVRRVTWGTFTNGANDSGGTIDTGLDTIDSFTTSVTSHVNATEPKVTTSSGNATIVTDDGVDGTWRATGL